MCWWGPVGKGACPLHRVSTPRVPEKSGRRETTQSRWEKGTLWSPGSLLLGEQGPRQGGPRHPPARLPSTLTRVRVWESHFGAESAPPHPPVLCRLTGPSWARPPPSSAPGTRAASLLTAWTCPLCEQRAWAWPACRSEHRPPNKMPSPVRPLLLLSGCGVTAPSWVTEPPASPGPGAQ